VTGYVESNGMDVNGAVLWVWGPTKPPRRASMRIGIVAFSLLFGSTISDAQQSQVAAGLVAKIPTIESLPHTSLPTQKFLGWCGPHKILLEEGYSRQTKVYDLEGKAPPLIYPEISEVQCGGDGKRLVFVDQSVGVISEIDTATGKTERMLASFDTNSFGGVRFSPDLNNVASSLQLTLSSAAIGLNIIPLTRPDGQSIRNVGWSRDSSALFGVSEPHGKPGVQAVEVMNAQRQSIGAGPLPAGFGAMEGWFATPRTMYFYLVPEKHEFGAGSIFKCAIARWRCEQVATNVLNASVSGDGILGMVRAVGKYSNDGETIKYPPAYVAEIRNSAGRVVARQTFKSAERTELELYVAPSGLKVAMTWIVHLPCAPQAETCAQSRNEGILLDLAEMIE
jgi:hypothetical protein